MHDQPEASFPLSVDALVDLSSTNLTELECRRLFEAWGEPSGLISAVAKGLCFLPSGRACAGWLPPAWRLEAGPARAEATHGFMAETGRSARALLVLLGPWTPGADAIGRLSQCLELDPLFGFALPRLSISDSDGILRLGGDLEATAPGLPRRIIGELPPTYILSEHLQQCFLVRPELAANLGLLDGGFETLAGALWHYLSRARRMGYRCVVENRTTVRLLAMADPTGSLPSCLPPQIDAQRLLDSWPDTGRARAEYGSREIETHEALVEHACAHSAGRPHSLLLDARGLQPTFNGTSQCVLGVCDGLYELGTDWDIGVWCDPAAAAFYGLKQRYPRWSLFTEWPGRMFGIALRLSQPWAISELAALHQLALVNVHLFLDTIAWDVVYAAPPHLDAVWRFAAAGADALCFISRYSLERFQSRFLRDRDVPTEVCLLSCDPRDYARPPSGSVPTEGAHILVMGNDYDHKAVRPTVELLATAFPYQSFVAFASGSSPATRIRSIPSGALSDEEVGRLYASTRLLVFPSHYEGFGFPVLTALAHDRTVLARRSALLDEVASHYRGPGELVEYGSPLELIERVGSILHGLAYPTKPLGAALGNTLSWRWTDTAQRLVGFLERVSHDPSRSRWEYRSQALAQIAAAGCPLDVRS